MSEGEELAIRAEIHTRLGTPRSRWDPDDPEHEHDWWRDPDERDLEYCCRCSRTRTRPEAVRRTMRLVP